VAPICFSGFQIDDQLEFRWLFDGQIRRLGAFEDFVHVSGGAAVKVSEMDSVGHKSTVLDQTPRLVHGRQAKLAGVFNYLP
jgi:hypothetical protein